MDFLNQVQGAQQIGFARSRRSAALINTAHSTCLAQNDGAASQSLFILGMTDKDTGDIGDVFSIFHTTPSRIIPEVF
jgi:hypothetical protein